MIQNYDLDTPAGKQAFEKYITMLIRNEVNSYVRQVLAERFSSTYIDTGTLTTSDRVDRLEQAVFKG